MLGAWDPKRKTAEGRASETGGGNVQVCTRVCQAHALDWGTIRIKKALNAEAVWELGAHT